MIDTTVRVSGLSKRYKLAREANRLKYRTLRDDLISAPRRLLAALLKRRLQSEAFWALENVTFEVKQGEVLGIIGRNGAGKSTLLKILSRTVDPTFGTADIFGRVGSLLEVGTGFHPELSGRENIYLSGAILGMKRSQVRDCFDEIVAFAEVEKFVDLACKHYSSGMYSRLGFSIAAHLAADVLIIDEVLAVGDTSFQKRCMRKMTDVARGGRTILFVSHNMSAVRNLCTSALLLEGGKAITNLGISEAIQRYSATSGGGGDSWERPESPPSKSHFIKSIKIKVVGDQPELSLQCDLLIICVEQAAAVFIAADILDNASTTIMQAVPHNEPFIPGRFGRYNVSFLIKLPPLIPGVYAVDFWIGSHFTNTADKVGGAISFEIATGPSANRSFPYTGDHGYIVPPSAATCHPVMEVAL